MIAQQCSHEIVAACLKLATHTHITMPTLPHHHHCNPVSPTAVLLADQHSDIFNFSQLKPDFSKWLPLLKDLGPFGDTNGEYGP